MWFLSMLNKNKYSTTYTWMYIFKNPPITTLLSNVKMGPKMTPINYVYLAVWERKYLHSPKTWECVMKTKQPNKLGLACSSWGLTQWAPAEGQSVVIVTQVVKHGNLSFGTHLSRNVPDDGFFCVSTLQAMSVFPFYWSTQGSHKPTIPQRRHLHPNIWDSVPVYPLNITAGDLFAKSWRNRFKRTCCFKLSHDRNIATQTVVCKTS